MEVKEIGAFEAKTHLSALLEKVQQGQTFYITKRGKRVAELRRVAQVKKTPELPTLQNAVAYVRRFGIFATLPAMVYSRERAARVPKHQRCAPMPAWGNAPGMDENDDREG